MHRVQANKTSCLRLLCDWIKRFAESSNTALTQMSGWQTPALVFSCRLSIFPLPVDVPIIGNEGWYCPPTETSECIITMSVKATYCIMIFGLRQGDCTACHNFLLMSHTESLHVSLPGWANAHTFTERKGRGETNQRGSPAFFTLFSLPHLTLLFFFTLYPFSLYLALSLSMQMEWNKCICSHGNNNIIVNGRCGDARAVMADSALSPWVTSWVWQTHTCTHTLDESSVYSFHSNPLCIDFAVWLKMQQLCVSTSVAPPKSITHRHTHTDIVFWTSGLSEWRQAYIDTHTECWWRQAGSSALGQYWTQTLSNLMTACLLLSLSIPGCLSLSISLSK